MKKSIFALLFISLGLLAGFLAHAFLSFHALQAAPTNKIVNLDNALNPYPVQFADFIFTGNTTGITRNTAYEFFQDYHDSSTPAGSKGCLKTEVRGKQESIIAFFLSDSLLLSPLRSMVVDTLGLNFAGLAGIPGYNESTNSHTMVWVAVSVEKDQDGNDVFNYVLPDDNDPGNTSLIMDYVDVCPVFCPENEARLWNDNWKE